MPRKRGIIFDFDGVIANTYRPNFITALVLELGYPVPDGSQQLLSKHWGMTTVEFLMLCFDLPLKDAQKVNSAWEQHDMDNHVPFIEGACEAVKLLADDGYYLAIVTSRERPSLLKLLRHEGIYHCFASLTAREDTAFPKPHPKAFDAARQTFRAFGYQKEDLVFVGDTIVDLEAGRAAGIDTIIVETGPYPHVHRDSHPHEAHLIIPSAAHLPDWLERAIEGFP